MIFVKPLDEGIISEIIRKSVPVISVEDGTVNGGLGSAIADRLSELNADISVTRIGIPDEFVTQGTPAELYKLCGMDAQSIASVIIEKVKNRHQ
jgi:1-deoxy-D-xylulose-5-phosphate synthase